MSHDPQLRQVVLTFTDLPDGNVNIAVEGAAADGERPTLAQQYSQLALQLLAESARSSGGFFEKREGEPC